MHIFFRRGTQRKEMQPRIQVELPLLTKTKVSAQRQRSTRKAPGQVLSALGSLVLWIHPSVLDLGMETLTEMMPSFLGINFSYKRVKYSCFQSFSMILLSQNYQLKIVFMPKRRISGWHILFLFQIWEWHFTTFQLQ